MLRKWQSLDIETPDGAVVTVTAVPAQHGQDGSEALVGEVTGFVLRGDGLPTTYVSGDNASLRVVREIADCVGKIDVAILFAGGASTPLVCGEYLTLNPARRRLRRPKSSAVASCSNETTHEPKRAWLR